MNYIYGWCDGTNGVGSKYDFRVGYEFINDTDKTSKKQFLKIKNEVRANTVNQYGYSTRATFRSYVNESLIYDQFLNLGKGYTDTNWVEIGTTTIELIHNDDGSYSSGEFKNKYLLRSRFSTNITSSYVLTSGRINDTYIDVPRIQVASGVLATDADVESVSNISILNRVDGFSYTLRYKLGNFSGTIVEKITRESYAWQIPVLFYQAIPKLEETCIIYCDTYSGNTLLGTNETSIVVRINVSKNTPTLSTTCKDINQNTIALTGNNQKVVKFFSNVEIVATAAAKNYATISSYLIKCADGKQAGTSKATLEQVESAEFVTTVVDSRGISASDIKQLELVEYIKLTANAVFQRRKPTDGKVLLTVNGNYFNQSFGTVSNTLSCKYRYRKKGESVWQPYKNVTATINENTYSINKLLLDEEFNYKEQYEFEFVAEDKLMIVPSSGSVSEGEYIWFRNKKGANFNVPIYFKYNKISTIDEIYPIGRIIIQVDETDPNELYTGTVWEKFAEGRTLVGVDLNDSDFNAILKTGGSKYLQKHSHQTRMYWGTGNEVQDGEKPFFTGAGSGTNLLNTNETGTGVSGNLQPYITVHFWRRIS